MKHDESKDVIALNRVGIKCFSATKQIEVDKSQLVGIKQWGRIDYLTNYRGYTLIMTDKNANVTINTEENADKSKSKRKKTKKTSRQSFV